MSEVEEQLNVFKNRNSKVKGQLETLNQDSSLLIGFKEKALRIAQLEKAKAFLQNLAKILDYV